jgi:hypothetical protein
VRKAPRQYRMEIWRSFHEPFHRSAAAIHASPRRGHRFRPSPEISHSQ